MKKRLYLLLVLVTLFTMFNCQCITYASTIDGQNMYSGYIVKNLDQYGNKLSDKSYHKDIQMVIKNSNVTSSSIEINGYILDGNDTPFDLVGNLYKSENSNKRVIGKLTDKNSNFNVVNFTIDNDPANSFFFDKNLNTSADVIAKLYLINNNRNFMYFEIANPEFLQNTLYSSSIDVQNLPSSDTAEELWYAKIIKTFKKDVKREAGKNPANDSISSSAVVPASMQTSSYNKIYTYQYNVGGVIVTETFVVNHYLSALSSIVNQGQWYAKLSILSENTSGNYPGFDSSDTNFHIGWYGPTVIRSYTDPGDAFDSLDWGGVFLQSGGIKFGIAWSEYSYSYGPLSFTVSYQNPTTTTFGTSKVFTNGTNLTRQAEVSVSNDYELCDNNHEFHVIFNVGHYNTIGTKRGSVEFEYDISNGLDYTYGGDHIDIEALSYSSGY